MASDALFVPLNLNNTSLSEQAGGIQTANTQTHGGSTQHIPFQQTSHLSSRSPLCQYVTENRVVTGQSNKYSGDSAKAYKQNPPIPPIPIDLAEKVKGMYRLLDLIGESGSNGYVDKIIIAQDSLQRFVNVISPGAYVSITKVDFRTLDQFMIRPLGVYGSKDEIVRLLLSIGAVDENVARLLLATTGVRDSRPTLSSGLYIVRADSTDLANGRHYVIYWPEDTTWDDSSTSSVLHNRETFMRYLTKLCDQVVALLSREHSASIIWDEEDSDTEDVAIGTGDSKRVFNFEVTSTSEQEANAVTRPGFQMNSRHISPYEPPPDCPVDPVVLTPCLLPGETTQGFLTLSYIPCRNETVAFDASPFNQLSLKQLLLRNALVLSENLDENAVKTLARVGIERLFSERCKVWHTRNQHIRTRQTWETTKDKAHRELALRQDSLRRVLREAVVDEVMTLFPSLDRDRLSYGAQACDDFNAGLERFISSGLAGATVASPEAPQPKTFLSDLESSYPGFLDVYRSHVRDARFEDEPSRHVHFGALKLRLVSIRQLLDPTRPLDLDMRANLIQAVLAGDFHRAQQILAKAEDKKRFAGVSVSAIGSLFSGSEDSLKNEMTKLAASVSDSQFLHDIKASEDKGMRRMIEDVETLAHDQLSVSINETVKKMTPAVLKIQQEQCERSLQHQMESEERNLLSDALREFIRDINAQSVGKHNSVLYIDRLDVKKNSLYPYKGSEYILTGRQEALLVPDIEWRVHLMDFTSDDKQNMQLDPKYIPTPTVNDRLSSTFRVPVNMDVIFYQILENERLLLVFLDGGDRVSIYLERLPEMILAIKRKRVVKSLKRERLGEHVLFAFDERKRALAVCASTKLQLYMFVFDETFKTLQGQGGPIDLASWYSQGGISIAHAAFVCGSEELVLVDSSARARVFSLVTMQFRPDSIQLQSLPSAIYSSPDGSCLLVLHAHSSEPSLTTYHWETFGRTDGIPLKVPRFPLQGAVLTSMVRRGRIFLLGLDIDAGSIQSIAVDITKNRKEYELKKDGGRNSSNNRKRRTQHNILLDCHAEVWSRFPVVPAVGRRTVTSSSKREQKRTIFISEGHSEYFSPYISDLVQKFKHTKKKPTGDELRNLKVSATQFGSLRDQLVSGSAWDVSRYRLGEWLVDLLCLIPIHIAICRDNRFVPLANGVLSADLERSLLGADVDKIVDKLSFGWYESIFQSYLATKPVKVVSSMGQQSVGKSFSLNHLLDTSFAGSAMRTTEGVWMSVTPTDEALIVALDFEGVGSVERSIQEDMLLVLFNTAISNLVLFRNNFAFTRDISGLFQSFQASASILDSKANASLFQSTLVIIIKDVVEADTDEIAREFSLKFEQIVQQEQDANFISRLHRGKLQIIPWPVIETKGFYKLFSELKKGLDKQKISHPTGHEFLHTIKTLMAKLKAKDWGALSQTMIEHRARTLYTILPIALAAGHSEVEPDFEPLKNLDTDVLVDGDDTAAYFPISDRKEVLPTDIEMRLVALRESWDPCSPRQSIPDSDWTLKLASHISGLIDLRVNHVKLWLECNLQRFQGDHAAITDLHRRFDKMVIEMKTNVQLCRVQCASCHLLCVRSRLHMGGHSCETDHDCAYDCAFCKNELTCCGTSAGHHGVHVCVVKTHLCGKPCKLSGKRGCLERCTKEAWHDMDEHMCAAPVHMCSKPCDLKEMKLQEGKTYSCHESCSIPSDQQHMVHSCDVRMCPMTCDLCKRLCIQPHLHGLEPDVFHSCGEVHPCPELCSAPGICQIDTVPLSIEDTSTGRHETVQYTKYSQVARRLQCIKTIEAGKTSHEGAHIHTSDGQSFHLCETRCPNCDYFCTLPHDHAEQEHETSHGSMTQIRWAVEGSDEADIEFGGLEFSSDEGAPAMCNFVCSSKGRHVHIDYCLCGEGKACAMDEAQHINTRITPDPERPKAAITHDLYWCRMGFKDPYSHDERSLFRKCDAMCSGSEHSPTDTRSGQPSYCTLPMFHPPRDPDEPVSGSGYISSDGHLFECRSPAMIEQAFHVIFVIDRSSSMLSVDHKPLPDTPAANRIRQYANDKLGAVYSALYSFWSARHVFNSLGETASTRRGLGGFHPALFFFFPALLIMSAVVEIGRIIGQLTAGRWKVTTRRDAYSVILFNGSTKEVLVNDLTSSPDDLLHMLLREHPEGSSNFDGALRAAEAIMTQNWSEERAPIMIFLSDGQGSVSDEVIQGVCCSAIQHGKPLSLHTVSFGEAPSTHTLRRMAELALKIQKDAARSGSVPGATNIPSSSVIALDTVRLTDTFLGIAESLRKPRAFAMH